MAQNDIDARIRALENRLLHEQGAELTQDLVAQIRTASEQLTALMVQAGEKATDIRNSKQYTAEYIQTLLGSLNQQFMGLSEQQVISVWGDVVTDENGTKTLDPNAQAWTLLRGAESGLETVRQNLRRGTIDPAWFQVAEVRARALVVTSITARDFLASYRAADPDVRAVLAELGPSMIMQSTKYHSSAQEWIGAINHLKRDHRASMDTPEHRIAFDRYEMIVRELKNLHGETQRAVNQFHGFYGSKTRTIYHAIDTTWRDVLHPSGDVVSMPYFRAKTWGWIAMENGGGYIVGVDSSF